MTTLISSTSATSIQASSLLRASLIIKRGHQPGVDPGTVFNDIKETDKIDEFISALLSLLDSKRAFVILAIWKSLTTVIKLVKSLFGAKIPMKPLIDVHFNNVISGASRAAIDKAQIYYGSLTGKTFADNLASRIRDEFKVNSAHSSVEVLHHTTAHVGSLAICKSFPNHGVVLEVGDLNCSTPHLDCVAKGVASYVESVS